MTAFAELPFAARRALAMRASMELLGFDAAQLFIVIVQDTPRPYDAAILGIALIRARMSTVTMAAGGIRRSWWNSDRGQTETIEAWNALSQAERNEIRQRYISAAELEEIVVFMADHMPRGGN